MSLLAKYNVTFIDNKTNKTHTVPENGFDIIQAIDTVRKTHAFSINVVKAECITQPTNNHEAAAVCSEEKRG